METILSFVLILTGAWFWFPYWEPFPYLGSGITGTGRVLEEVLGVFFVGVAFVNMWALSNQTKFRSGLRRRAVFGVFVSYATLTGLAMHITGPAGIRWTAYLALALISAVSYLSVSLGDGDG